MAKERKKTLIIAEIGTSHQGDLAKAVDLIKAAKDAGADCVKFQLVFADEIIHPGAGLVDLPSGNIDLYSQFKKLEIDLLFLRELKGQTEKYGLLFLCTPFGIKSSRILHDLGVTVFKIASPELNHVPLIKEIAGYNLPVLLSTGVSTLADIEKAVHFFPREKVTLLHCITAYPAPETEYNLKLLKNFSAIFGVPVGVSDHSMDPVLVPALSVIMGGGVVEKHFTLSRLDSGLDDPIALEPDQFNAMVTEIREAEKLSPEDAMDGMRNRFGSEKIEAVLGDGIKKIPPSEKANYGFTNRSIHALCKLHKDDILSIKNCAVLRSEKNLKPGMHPEFFELILGKKVRRTIDAGQGIVFEDLL
ncbi:MAG: N-acetylneuraminate synthase family protein [Spirochaetales bacterium]|nr:N-acetylneuraminate synthase family protein [Spirochaetales bacterium]